MIQIQSRNYAMSCLSLCLSLRELVCQSHSSKPFSDLNLRACHYAIWFESWNNHEKIQLMKIQITEWLWWMTLTHGLACQVTWDTGSCVRDFKIMTMTPSHRMGWLRVVASINTLLQGSFAKETYNSIALLQKRPVILFMLLTKATPSLHD